MGSTSTSKVVAAFAEHAKLRLSESERERLEAYVEDVWDMAARLREVVTPGLEGLREQLPLRAAYSNEGPERANESRPANSAAADVAEVPDDVLDLGLVEVAARIRAGEVDPLGLTTALLRRIERYDPAVRSYITVDEEGALAAAAALSQELRDGQPRSLLHGVPIGAKDNIPAAGMRCTYNSPLTKDWVPKRDAEAVRRVRRAGAIMVGKHNLNEFGWSLPREDDLAPPPRNPWFPEEYSVGSSSGGGAAVAARLAFAALGTDGGGSIRLPAGQHLLFGLKPGHRRVPGQGVSEGSVSEVSVLARRAEDVAAVFATLLIDPDEPAAAERLRLEPPARVDEVRAAPPKLRIGIPQGYLEDVGMEPSVKRLFDDATRACEDLGFELVALPRKALDILHDAVRANFVVIAAEHFFDHEGPGADRSRYGESAGFYNLPGACLSAADYLHAVRVGDLTRQAIDRVLGEVDMIFTPTSPVTRTSTARNPTTHRRGGNAAYTAPFNISGYPGVSFPVGLSDEGIPIGLQLIGRPEGEFDLLRAGRAISGRFDLPAFPDLNSLLERGG